MPKHMMSEHMESKGGGKGKGGKGKRGGKSKAIVARMMHEVKHDEPSIVAKTRAKKGASAAAAQKTAIALSKARAAGAHIRRVRSA